jgi:pimeloyl-ACP methyl ester carboxylesterase
MRNRAREAGRAAPTPLRRERLLVSVTAVEGAPDPRREGTVQVRDGRAVGFAEWGDPAGPPVLAFHGGPGSRRMATGCERAAAGELGLRLVCLERPGFGLSDRAPSRTLIGWADDVADATQALGIVQFVVVGVSAGAPYALACGARLPDLVRRVGIVGGVAPFAADTSEPFAALVARDRPEAEAAARQHFEAMAANVDASVAAMAARAGPDQAVYSRHEVQEQFRRTRREAFRSGVEGAVVELLLVHEPWGFELRDVAVACHWWHGALDPVSPLAGVRAATASMRDCRLTVYADEGHAIGFTHGDEILASLGD